MAIVVGAVLGAMAILVVLVLVRRRRERTDRLFGTAVPPTLMAPTSRPIAPPRPTPGVGHPGGFGRRGDDVTVVRASGAGAMEIHVDGQVYRSIDDIPDPSLRERVRRLLGH